MAALICSSETPVCVCPAASRKKLFVGMVEAEIAVTVGSWGSSVPTAGVAAREGGNVSNREKPTELRMPERLYTVASNLRPRTCLPDMRIASRSLAVAASLCALALPAAAQTTELVVRVRVRDSSAAPGCWRERRALAYAAGGARGRR